MILWLRASRSFCDTRERPRCLVHWNARFAVSQASSLARMAARLRVCRDVMLPHMGVGDALTLGVFAIIFTFGLAVDLTLESLFAETGRAPAPR